MLPRDGDGDGDDDDDDAQMAEDATPAAIAGVCVAAFSEDFGFAAASVAKYNCSASAAASVRCFVFI